MNEQITKSVRVIANESAAFIKAMKGEERIDTNLLRRIGEEYLCLAHALDEDLSPEEVDQFQELRKAIEDMATGSSDDEFIVEGIVQTGRRAARPSDDGYEFEEETDHFGCLPSAIAKRLREQFGKN